MEITLQIVYYKLFGGYVAWLKEIPEAFGQGPTVDAATQEVFQRLEKNFAKRHHRCLKDLHHRRVKARVKTYQFTVKNIA